MSALQLDIPESLIERVKLLADKDGVSIDDFIALALTEKVATLETADYLAERARRGSRERMLEILAKAPDMEPDEVDRL